MEKERLQLCMQRFDGYYDSMNNKSSVYLIVGTFILGMLLAGIPHIKTMELHSCYPLLLKIALGIGLSSMILIVYSAIPFTNTPNDSLYFFGNIAGKERKQFIKISKNTDENKEVQDLRNQVYILSVGLTRKCRVLKIAGVLLVLEFILLFPLTYLVLI